MAVDNTARALALAAEKKIEALAAGFVFKGKVPTMADLPTVATNGWTYYVIQNQAFYTYLNGEWLLHEEVNVWGSIKGDIEDQADLMELLEKKENIIFEGDAIQFDIDSEGRKTIHVIFDDRTIRMSEDSELFIPIDEETIVVNSEGKLTAVPEPLQDGIATAVYYDDDFECVDVLYDSETLGVDSENRLYVKFEELEAVEPIVIDSENKINLLYDSETLGVNSEGKLFTKAEKLPYISLERLCEYTYRVTFDELPEEEDVSNLIPAGCTSFVRDGKLFRNLDWNYDNTADFNVVTKNFEGTAFINGLNDSNLDNKLIAQLPYHIVDGVNRDGIMVASHVIYNDFGIHSEGEANVPLTKLPYLVLENVHKMSDISVITPYLENIKVNPDAEYLAQILVTDGVTSKLITPAFGVYESVDITTNPKLTNFQWTNSKTVNRLVIGQNRPTGVERWNLVDNEIDLQDLRFTKAYEEPTRLSEFIGIDGTTKLSTDEELEAIYNLAHAEYLDRHRDGKTWHTVHSIVYTPEGMKHWFVQENYNRDLIPQRLDAEEPIVIEDDIIKVKYDGQSIILNSEGQLQANVLGVAPGDAIEIIADSEVNTINVLYDSETLGIDSENRLFAKYQDVYIDSETLVVNSEGAITVKNPVADITEEDIGKLFVAGESEGEWVSIEEFVDNDSIIVNSEGKLQAGKVLVDSETVIINEAGEISVPIDRETIIVDSEMVMVNAYELVAGDGIKIYENTDENVVIAVDNEYLTSDEITAIWRSI